MNEHQYGAALLVEAVLHDLAVDTESALFLASALEAQSAEIESNAGAKRLRETAALLKSGALQLGLAAANLVGTAERLRLAAELDSDVDSGELPS